jgi:hypothetical protein
VKRGFRRIAVQTSRASRDSIIESNYFLAAA